MRKRPRESRESRAVEKRAQAHKAAEEPSWLNRRTLLITGGITIGSIISWATYQHYSHVHEVLNSEEKESPDAEIKTAEKGTVVFEHEQGEASRTFVGIKQVHGGISTIDVIRKVPRYFENFADHQEGIRTMLQEYLESDDIGKVHFFLEGFSGEPEEWGDYKKTLATVTEMDELLRDPEKRNGVLKVISDGLHTARPEESVGAFHLLNAGGRLVAYCTKKNYDIVHGADPVGHPTLSELFHNLIRVLAQKENPTDEEIEAFINEITIANQKDEQVRHEYISEQLQRYVPKDGIGVVVLGASHFNAGTILEEGKAVHPLEAILSKIPDSRTIVIDQSNLPALMTRVPGSVVIGKVMQPQQVRMYLKQIRKNK